jgi:hypothetical protein
MKIFAIVITGCILLLFILLLYLIIKEEKDSRAAKWVKVEPWKDCPDCGGTGYINTQCPKSSGYVECHCTQMLIE